MASNIGVARSILNHKGRKYFIVNINKQQGETNYIIYKDNIYKHKLIDTEIDEYWFKDNRRGYRVKDCWWVSTIMLENIKPEYRKRFLAEMDDRDVERYNELQYTNWLIKAFRW